MDQSTAICSRYNNCVQQMKQQWDIYQHLVKDEFYLEKTTTAISALNCQRLVSELGKLVSFFEIAQKMYLEHFLPKYKKHSIFSDQDFEQIERILEEVNRERLIGKVYDEYNHFVRIKPPTKIVGVDPLDYLVKYDPYWVGVFIPGRTVILREYSIAKKTVTYELWQEVYKWAIEHGYEFMHCGYRGSHDAQMQPVTAVNWYDCVVWCNAYTEMIQGNTDECVYRVLEDTSQIIKSCFRQCALDTYYEPERTGYRLPTEAEWEYAARYQGSERLNGLRYGYEYLTNLDCLSGGILATSDNIDNCQRVACFDGNCHISRSCNLAGLYDMSGNIWEWCYDLIDFDNMDMSLKNPRVDINPVGSMEEGIDDYRIVRGGSWLSQQQFCVVGHRHAIPELDNVVQNNEFGSDLGFRLAHS